MGAATLVKILVTMVAVLSLTLIAEKVSTRAAGILAGFPHGIAIVLFFIGIEQGADFAAQAAHFAIAGLSANLVLAFVFARLSNWPVIVAATGAVFAFLMAAMVLDFLSPGPVFAVILTSIAIVIIWRILRGLDNIEPLKKSPIKPTEMLFRAIFAAAIVVFITGMATVLGPEWAGLLAGFPVVTFPLLVIIHARHGAAPIETIVRHYPFGLISLLVFTVTVSWSFSNLGMVLGTGVGLLSAVLYLVAISIIRPLK